MFPSCILFAHIGIVSTTHSLPSSSISAPLPVRRCFFSHNLRLAKEWHWLIEIPEDAITVFGESAECHSSSECLLLWATSPSGDMLPILQGCTKTRARGWKDYVCPVGGTIDKNTLFGDYEVPPSMEGIQFASLCVCSDDLCNDIGNRTMERNVCSDDELEEDMANLCRKQIKASTTFKNIMQLALGSLSILTLIALFLLFIALRRRMRRTRKPRALGDEGIALTEVPLHSEILGQIEMKWREDGEECVRASHAGGEQLLGKWELREEDIIGSGHFATVYRAATPKHLSDSLPGLVAVKVFPLQHGNTFFNEVYHLRSLVKEADPRFVKIFAAALCMGETAFQSEWRLAMQLCSGGSLQQLLKEETLDWKRFFSLSTSLTEGLTFLHMEININGICQKRRIAHRDINSRNILLSTRDCGIAVIADFSLALSDDSLHGEVAELRIQDIGTTRYMAPELLEGCLNLHDACGSLIYADAYAAGLVLWEMLSRTREVYEDASPPEYSAPYTAELSLQYPEWSGHPSYEHMMCLVVKGATRPSFPPAFYEKRKMHLQPKEDAIMVALCDVIRDLWHSEPEARASMACTAERLSIHRRTLFKSESPPAT